MLLAFVLLTAPNQELTEREVKALVIEYIALAEKGDPKMLDSLRRLRSGKPILAQRTLRDMLSSGKQPQVSYALELVYELRVPGLWTSLSKYLDTVDEEKTIRAAFATADKTTMTALLQRWAKIDSASASWILLTGGFMKYPLADEKTLDSFKEYATFNDATRSQSARDILCAQFGFSRPDEVINNYVDLKSKYLSFGKPAPITGSDLLELIELTGATRMGASIHGEGNGQMMAINKLPPLFTSRSLDIRFKVFPKSAGMKISIHTNQKGDLRQWNLEMDEKDWYVRTGSGDLYKLPVKLNEWAPIRISVRPVSNAGHPCDRHATIEVDGKLLLQNGCVQGDFYKFEILFAKADAYVSGMEAILR